VVAALEFEEGGPNGSSMLCNGFDDDGDALIDEGCSVGGVAGLLDSPDALVSESSAGDRTAPVAAVGAIASLALVGARGWYVRRRFSRN
jgi:hypothetical protein